VLEADHIAPLLPEAAPTADELTIDADELDVPSLDPKLLSSTVDELSGPLDDARARAAGARSITIGYHDNNALAIRAPQISGYHARLTRSADGVITLTDLNSTNGCFVRGDRIEGPTVVEPGETIGLGSYSLTLDEDVLSLFEPKSERKSAATLAIDVSDVVWQQPEASELRIGRADDNDIVIPAPQVSGYHAVLEPTESGWLLTDVGSLNGTYVNVRSTPLPPHTEVEITTDDVIFLGSYRFPMSRLADFLRDRGEGEAIELPDDKDVISIGRGEDNDIVLDAPQVSRHHARLERQGEHWILVDLDSANGTYVDGTRVSRCRIEPDNLIAFGTYLLRLDPKAGIAHTGYQGEIMLRAEQISVDVPDAKSPGGTKRILDDISFTAYPTEFIGIMGPSGAGKTTLMMALNGYLPPSQGQSLINNLDLYRHYNQFRGNIGYVPQDDIIHRELSVYESLYFTAKLRLPPDTSDAEIERLIDRILDDLGILETKHVLIGSPMKKGISGGQRKRVNLAQELITQPSLLFLDEPTSGLASSDTRSVMQLLRRLADEGRTILLTIHQPSLEAYREMDNVLYLARGELVYYGPTYPDSILFFNPDVEEGTPEAEKLLSNPDNAMAPIARDSSAPDFERRLEDRCEAYEESKYYQDYVAGRRESQEQVQLTASRKQRAERTPGWRQWWILTRRTLTIKRKDVINSAILLLQAPIIGLLIALVFGLDPTSDSGSPIEVFTANQRAEGIDAAALFMLVASAVWFGCSNSAREIVGELAIYRRERMLNLKIPSYVMSKFTVLGLLSLIQCTVLLGIAYPLLGFHGSFFAMLLLLFLCSTAGLGIGLTLSALVRSTEAAVALVPLLLIPQIVLGGFIVPVDALSGGGLRTAVRMGSNAMVTRWAFEGVLHAESAERPPPPTIRPSEEAAAQAASFRENPELICKPRRFLGQALPDPRCLDTIEGISSTRIANELERRQSETSMVDRYFGRFAGSYLSMLGVLLAFNLGLLVVVCLLLRTKDTEAS